MKISLQPTYTNNVLSVVLVLF